MADAWRTARDDPRRARDEANGVLAACGPADVECRAAALRVRGWAERVIFSHTEALATLDEGVRLARRHHLVVRLAELLTARASVWLEIGDFARARRDRLAARRALGGIESIELDAHEAVYEIKLGHHAEAARLCRSALDRLGDRDESILRFQLLTNLGTSLLSLGDIQGAEDAYARGARVAEGIGRLALGFVTQGLGMSAVRRGDLPEGLRRFDRAEELLQETGWPMGEYYLDRIESFMTLRLLDEAQDAVDRAVRYLSGPGGRMLLAETLLHQARLHIWRGRFDEAAAVARSASDLLQRQRRGGYRAQAEMLRAEAILKSGACDSEDLRAARRAAHRLDSSGFLLEGVDGLLTVAKMANAVGVDAVARNALGRVAERCRGGSALLRVRCALAEASLAELAGNGPAARRAVRRGLAALERFRSTLPTSELRALAGAHGVELTAIALRSLLHSRRPRDLLAWMERGRVASARHAPTGGGDAEVADLFSQLRDAIAGQRVGGSEDAVELDRLRSEQMRVERRIVRRLRTVDPSAIAPHRVATVAEIRRALGGSTLLEISEVDGELVGVTLTGDMSTVARLGPAADALAELASLSFGLRRIMRARSAEATEAISAGIAHALTRLDTLLAEPLLPDNRHAGRVVVIPPAPLFAVPWHALPTLTRRAVTVAPSATLWHRASEARSSTGRVVIAAGPGLREAEQEALEVSLLYPRSRLFLPGAAAVGEVVAAIDGAGMAHLTCHGTFRSDNPSFSSLELTDGPMTVLDLERMTRAPALVVLASCDSGVSEALPGDELLGLTTALFALGTRAAVASVAPVPDVESRPLMIALHERLARGVPLVEALTEARAQLDPSTPAGLVARVAYGCFGAGDVTIGGLS